MVSKFWVVRRKDGEYLRQGHSRYGSYWSCTTEIEAATRYDVNNKELSGYDIDAYVKSHKKTQASDFELVCFVATYKEIRANKAKEE